MKGLTLIETLIYLALAALIVSLVVVSVYPIIDSSSRLEAWIEVENEANFILRKLNWALTDISNINQPLASATSTTVSVNKNNFSQNPIVFDVNSGNLQMALAGGSPVVLSNENVKIDKVVFEHIIANGTSSAIGIELIVGHQSFNASTTIRTKMGLRK